MDMTETTPTKRKKRPFLTALGVLCVLFLIVICAVLIYPAPILRYVFSRVEVQSGIILTFEKAHIYFGNGSSLTLNGLAAKRHNHHVGNFDVTAERVELFMFSGIVQVSGLRGTYERAGNVPADKNGHEGKENTSQTTFFSALTLTDVEVVFIDRTLERPFQATIRLENFVVASTGMRSLFEPYVCIGTGQIESAEFIISLDSHKHKIEFTEVPLGLFAPYAPVLDDIFVSGSMNIFVDDLSDAAQKRLRVSITLLPDCTIKPANEILAPTIQAALQKLDQSSVPELRDVKTKIERLKISSESLRTELDKAAQIIDTLKVLAPREVREKYENFKSRYDRATVSYGEWNTKFETLERELDQVKVGIVNDTFQHFIITGTPIEMDLHEVDGEWQYDWYDTVVRLIEQNYQSVIAAKYQARVQEMRDAVDRLLMP